MALAGIIIAGTALVFFAWNARDVEALQPTFGDHWHVAYGIYDCRIDGFQGPLQDPQTTNAGIHTHSDGVAHVHPFSSTATGGNANLGTFLEATRATIEDDVAMVFEADAGRPELSEVGTECNGEEVVLQIARFAPGETTASEVITENLNEFEFNADQEGMVIALAPAGFDIPPPPADAVATAAAASPSVIRTDGLEGLNTLPGTTGDNVIGFDDDGNLVGPDGAPITGDDGEPINRTDLEAEAVEAGEDDG